MDEKLSLRFYKTIGDTSFIAMYMRKEDVTRGVLSVFMVTEGYEYVMDISLEYWNDAALTGILNRAVRP